MHVNISLAHYQLPLHGTAPQAGHAAADPAGSSVRQVTGSGELSSATWPTTVEVPPKSGTPLEFGDWLARTANYRAAVRLQPKSEMPPTALQNAEDDPRPSPADEDAFATSDADTAGPDAPGKEAAGREAAGEAQADRTADAAARPGPDGGDQGQAAAE